MSFVLVTPDASGFAVGAGERVRILAWLPADALRVMPWEAPGTADIQAALAPGLGGLHLLMPWDQVPAAWESAPVGAVPPAGDEPFVVRAEGVATSTRIPSSIPVRRSNLRIAAVWRDPAALPAPAPVPSSRPSSDPSPPPQAPSPVPPGPAPSPRPRALAPDPLPPPKPPKRRSTLPWLLGLGAVVATVTFARARRTGLRI